MMRVIRVLAYGAGLFVLLALPAAGDELKAGDQAPDFTLKASDGQTYSLSALRGKNVVLAWFPKAFTAG
jgi:peroxiredoxin